MKQLAWLLAYVVEQAKWKVLDCIYDYSLIGFHESLIKEDTIKIKVQDMLQKVKLEIEKDKRLTFVNANLLKEVKQ